MRIFQARRPCRFINPAHITKYVESLLSLTNNYFATILLFRKSNIAAPNSSPQLPFQEQKCHTNTIFHQVIAELVTNKQTKKKISCKSIIGIYWNYIDTCFPNSSRQNEI